MPTLNAVDSYSAPDPAKLARNGIQVSCRYLSTYVPKNLTQSEAENLHAHGVSIVLNWESQPGRPLGGAPFGAEDGQEAARQARALGAPAGTVIYFSCDTDANSSQFPVIASYYRAAKANLGGYLVGVYGEADLIDYLVNSGAVDRAWQTLAWSGGRVSPHAVLYQYEINTWLNGMSVDYDTILNYDKLGAWWAPGKGPQVTWPPVTKYQWHEVSHGGQIHAPNNLATGAVLYSQDRRHKLKLLPDGCLIVQKRTLGVWRKIWSSHTMNLGVNRLAVQRDGNLVLYRDSTPIWSSQTPNSGANVLAMQNDGNLVLYRGQHAVWNSKTAGK